MGSSKIKYSIILIFAFMLFTACRKHSSREYEIKNTSDASIRVTFKIANGTSSDQTILVGVAETTNLYTEDLGAGRVEGSEKQGEYIGVFNKLEVAKNSTLPAKKDFLKTASWHYDEPNPHRAVYTCTVTNLDF